MRNVARATADVHLRRMVWQPNERKLVEGARAHAAYFQRLGIDVWMRRTRQPPVAAQTAAPSVAREVAAPLPRPRHRTATAVVSRSAVSPATDTPPGDPVREPDVEVAPSAFRIRCFRYGRVFVAIDEDAWPRRRFLLGVALALNGFESAERTDIVFEWPQRGVDPHASARSFRAFFRHQTRAGERALLSGTQVPRLLGHAAPAQTTTLNDHLYVAPHAPDAAARRALWQLIQGLHRTDPKHA